MDDKNLILAETMKISERKLTANRLNAQKSTGPKTTDGKKKSKINALKHGLRAQELVILPLGEVESAFSALLRQLTEQFAPRGILEETEVGKIAVYTFRLQRVYRYEGGVIRLRVEKYLKDEADNQEKFSQACLMNRSHSDDFKHQMKQSSVGIKHLISMLNSIHFLVKTEGSDSQLWLNMLITNFNHKEDSIISECIKLAEEAVTAPSEPEIIDGKRRRSKKQCEKNIMHWARVQREEFEILLKKVEKREQREKDAMLDSLSLPTGVEMDNILRYEAAINRELHRSISELERLQRLRKGESVLPPIKVDVLSQN